MARWSLSRQKSPDLKECENPKCNNMFWAISSNKKYCCKKCRIQHSNMKHSDYRKEWKRLKKLRLNDN